MCQRKDQSGVHKSMALRVLEELECGPRILLPLRQVDVLREVYAVVRGELRLLVCGNVCVERVGVSYLDSLRM